ncbi:hypothetical protein PENTCL1PPCAC_21887, partial [Pristionchus entomophagus]
VKFFFDMCTKENSFPAYLASSLIGSVVRIGRDASGQRAIGVRIDALFIVVHLLTVASSAKIRHSLIDQVYGRS